MEKPTETTNYRFGDDKIEVMPYFLYEVTIYQICKSMARLLESKYYKSDKLLKVKDTAIKYSDYSIVRNITLLAAPIEFIKENNLQEYQLKKKK